MEEEDGPGLGPELQLQLQRRGRGGAEQDPAAGAAQGQALSGQSYWLDLWLFILFDVALLVIVSLLP